MIKDSFFKDKKIINFDFWHIHLKLGYAHLKNVLNSKQLNELLAKESQEKLKSGATCTEKISQFTPIFNTVLTSVYGAALGFSAMIDFSINSFLRLYAITILALLVSLIMGFLCNRVIKKDVKQSHIDKNIFLKHRAILKKILKRTYQEMQVATLQSNLLLCKLNKKTWMLETEQQDLNSRKILFKNIKLFLNQNYVEKTQLSHLFKYKNFKENLTKKFFQLKNIVLAEKNDELAKKLHAKKSYYIVIKNLKYRHYLSHFLPNQAALKVEKEKTQETWYTLLHALLPTLLGTFASLFVFVNGIPDIAEQIGADKLANVLSHTYVKKIELVLMIVTTAYLTLCFYFARKKSQEREEEKQYYQKSIQVEEVKVNQLTLQKERVIKVYILIKEIYLMTKIIKNKQIRKKKLNYTHLDASLIK